MRIASECPHTWSRALRRCMVLTAHLSASSSPASTKLSFEYQEILHLRSQLHEMLMLNQALQHKVAQMHLILQQYQHPPPNWMPPPQMSSSQNPSMLMPPFPAPDRTIAAQPAPTTTIPERMAPEGHRVLEEFTTHSTEDPVQAQSTCRALVPAPGSRAHKA